MSSKSLNWPSKTVLLFCSALRDFVPTAFFPQRLSESHSLVRAGVLSAATHTHAGVRFFPTAAAAPPGARLARPCRR
jgi:hypothetical protein